MIIIKKKSIKIFLGELEMVFLKKKKKKKNHIKLIYVNIIFKY